MSDENSNLDVKVTIDISDVKKSVKSIKTLLDKIKKQEVEVNVLYNAKKDLGQYISKNRINFSNDEYTAITKLQSVLGTIYSNIPKEHLTGNASENTNKISNELTKTLNEVISFYEKDFKRFSDVLKHTSDYKDINQAIALEKSENKKNSLASKTLEVSGNVKNIAEHLNTFKTSVSDFINVLKSINGNSDNGIKNEQNNISNTIKELTLLIKSIDLIGTQSNTAYQRVKLLTECISSFDAIIGKLVKSFIDVGIAKNDTKDNSNKQKVDNVSDLSKTISEFSSKLVLVRTQLSELSSKIGLVGTQSDYSVMRINLLISSLEKIECIAARLISVFRSINDDKVIKSIESTKKLSDDVIKSKFKTIKSVLDSLGKSFSTSSKKIESFTKSLEVFNNSFSGNTILSSSNAIEKSIINLGNLSTPISDIVKRIQIAIENADKFASSISKTHELNVNFNFPTQEVSSFSGAVVRATEHLENMNKMLTANTSNQSSNNLNDIYSKLSKQEIAEAKKAIYGDARKGTKEEVANWWKEKLNNGNSNTQSLAGAISKLDKAADKLIDASNKLSSVTTQSSGNNKAIGFNVEQNNKNKSPIGFKGETTFKPYAARKQKDTGMGDLFGTSEQISETKKELKGLEAELASLGQRPTGIGREKEQSDWDKKKKDIEGKYKSETEVINKNTEAVDKNTKAKSKNNNANNKSDDKKSYVNNNNKSIVGVSTNKSDTVDISKLTINQLEALLGEKQKDLKNTLPLLNRKIGLENFMVGTGTKKIAPQTFNEQIANIKAMMEYSWSGNQVSLTTPDGKIIEIDNIMQWLQSQLMRLTNIKQQIDKYYADLKNKTNTSVDDAKSKLQNDIDKIVKDVNQGYYTQDNKPSKKSEQYNRQYNKVDELIKAAKDKHNITGVTNPLKPKEDYDKEKQISDIISKQKDAINKWISSSNKRLDDGRTKMLSKLEQNRMNNLSKLVGNNKVLEEMVMKELSDYAKFMGSSVNPWSTVNIQEHNRAYTSDNSLSSDNISKISSAIQRRLSAAKDYRKMIESGKEIDKLEYIKKQYKANADFTLIEELKSKIGKPAYDELLKTLTSQASQTDMAYYNSAYTKQFSDVLPLIQNAKYAAKENAEIEKAKKEYDRIVKDYNDLLNNPKNKEKLITNQQLSDFKYRADEAAKRAGITNDKVGNEPLGAINFSYRLETLTKLQQEFDKFKTQYNEFMNAPMKDNKISEFRNIYNELSKISQLIKDSGFNSDRFNLNGIKEPKNVQKLIDEAKKELSDYEKLKSLLERFNKNELSYGVWERSKLNRTDDSWESAFNARIEKARQLKEEIESLGGVISGSKWLDNSFSNYKLTQRSANPVGLSLYSDRINNLRPIQEQNLMAWIQQGDPKSLQGFMSATANISKLSKEYENFNKILGNTASTWSELWENAKHHLGYMTSGMMVGTPIMALQQTFDTLKDIEFAMAGIMQVMPSLEHSVNNEIREAKDLIGIASRYGESVSSVMESAKSIGRMYGKDFDEKGKQQEGLGVRNTNIMTSQATKMAIADAFSVEEAFRGLESAMAQWNLQTENSNELMVRTNRLLETWTITAHNGAASGSDIANAIEVAGTAAAQAGMSFEFFNALLATGVRQTARSGSEIGQAIKSMTVSMESSKARSELEKWGIDYLEKDKDGNSRVRNIEELILDVSAKISTTDKDTHELLTALSGGKYQFSKVSAMLSNPDELYRLLGLINDPSKLKSGSDGKSFTDEQVEIQLDTTLRKLETIKADIESLIYSIGANGGFEVLKTLLTYIDRVIVGFDELINRFGKAMLIGASVAGAVLALGKLISVIEKARYATSILKTATELESTEAGRASILHRALFGTLTQEEKAKIANKLASMGYTSETIRSTAAIRAETTAINLDTAATNANNSSKINASKISKIAAAGITALGGPIGIVITSLSILIPLIAGYAESIGEAKKSSEEELIAEKERIATIENEADALNRKEKFLKQLSTQYNNMKDSIDSGTLSEKEMTKTKEKMKSIERALADTLHADSKQFITDNKVNEKSIESLMKLQKKELVNRLKSESDKIDIKIETALKELEIQEQIIAGNIKEQDSIDKTIDAYDRLSKAIEKKRMAEKGIAFLSNQGQNNVYQKMNPFGIMGGINAINSAKQAEEQNYISKGIKGLEKDKADADQEAKEIIKAQEDKIQQLKNEQGDVAQRIYYIENGQEEESTRGIYQEDEEKKIKEENKKRKEDLKKIKGKVEIDKKAYETIKKSNEEISKNRALTEEEKQAEKDAHKKYRNTLMEAANELGVKNGIESVFETVQDKFSWTGDSELDKYIADAAREFGVPAKIIASIAKSEGEDFNQNALSSEDAYGVMQLIPETAARFGVDRYDKRDNVRGGANYLKVLYDMFGDWEIAAAAYNAGEGRVQYYNGIPPIQETIKYVERFKKYLNEYTQYINDYANGVNLKKNYTSLIPDLDDDDVRVDEVKLYSSYAEAYDSETKALSNKILDTIKKDYEISNKAIDAAYNNAINRLGNYANDIDKNVLMEKKINAELNSIKTTLEEMTKEGFETYDFYKELNNIKTQKVYELNKLSIEKITSYYSLIEKLSAYNDVVESSTVLKKPNTNKSIFSESPLSKENFKVKDFYKNKSNIEYEKEEENLQKLMNQYHELAANPQADIYTLMDVNQKIIESYKKLSEASNQYHATLINNLESISEEIFLSDSGSIFENTESVAKKLWKGLASDAMKALWGVKNDNPSALGQMIGLGSPDLTKQQIVALESNRHTIEQNTIALNRLIAIESDRAYINKYGKQDYDVMAYGRKLSERDFYESLARSDASNGLYGEYYKPKYIDFHIDDDMSLKSADELKKRDKLISDYNLSSYNEFKATGDMTHNPYWRRDLIDARPSILKDNNAQPIQNVNAVYANNNLQTPLMPIAQPSIGSNALSSTEIELQNLNMSAQSAAASVSNLNGKINSSKEVTDKKVIAEDKEVSAGRMSTDTIVGIQSGLMALNLAGNNTVSMIANVIGALLPFAVKGNWFGIFGNKDGGKLATGGSLSSLPAFSTGGSIRTQDSGKITGAGTGRSDSILTYLANKDKFVWLSNGEYVINEKSAKALGTDTLDSLNAYADGGALSANVVEPVPYVPSINPQVVSRYTSSRDNSSLAMQRLLMEQNKKMDEQSKIMSGLGSDGNNGGVVVLNTHASSDDVMRALSENPRALNAILGRNNRMGFR